MKPGQEWTQEQIDYLTQHYGSERAEDVAAVIGKSKSSVQHKANRLGLGKDKEKFREIRRNASLGEKSGHFKNYRARTSKGYIAVYVPSHPYASKAGRVLEHRLVMEKELGMYIPKNFAVHHINGIKDDNRIENLALMTVSAHNILHNRMGKNMKRGEDHPLYKQIDFEKAEELKRQGLTVKEICCILNCSKTNYYKKVKGA